MNQSTTRTPNVHIELTPLRAHLLAEGYMGWSVYAILAYVTREGTLEGCADVLACDREGADDTLEACYELTEGADAADWPSTNEVDGWHWEPNDPDAASDLRAAAVLIPPELDALIELMPTISGGAPEPYEPTEAEPYTPSDEDLAALPTVFEAASDDGMSFPRRRTQAESSAAWREAWADYRREHHGDA